jgi:hypothetical protein
MKKHACMPKGITACRPVCRTGRHEGSMVSESKSLKYIIIINRNSNV